MRILHLTWEQFIRWNDSITQRMLMRQAASAEVGPSQEIEVQAPGPTPDLVMDRWVVPECSTSGAW